MSDMRDEFEKWAELHIGWNDLELKRDNDDPDSYLMDITQYAWSAWQAARAQGGQGAEPVALLRREIGESSWFDHVPVKPNTQEADALKNSPILDYCEVYTQPRPSGSSEALILRKQAEAVELLSCEWGHGELTYSGREVKAELEAEAQRLRQQADEAEKAGGEK